MARVRQRVLRRRMLYNLRVIYRYARMYQYRVSTVRWRQHF